FWIRQKQQNLFILMLYSIFTLVFPAFYGALSVILKGFCSGIIHEPLLAPTEEILNDYKKKRNTWEDYEKRFLSLMADRKIEQKLNYELFKVPTVLLCSEGSSRYCHRRLILEYLQDKWGDLSIVHL
ncbi:hypothetical protein DK28_0209210, partial [Peptococcaceae bacterium SCADC1_2_3]